MLALALASLALLAGSARSLLIGNLPVAEFASTCADGIRAIAAADPAAAACMNTDGLLAVSANFTSHAAALGFFEGACAAPACGNDTIAFIMRSLRNTSGFCEETLKIQSLFTASLDADIAHAQAVYPVVRRIACLKDTTTDALCLANGTNLFFDSRAPEPCSDCNKQALNIAMAAGTAFFNATLGDFFLGRDITLVDPILQNCGASFTDGAVPLTVQDSGNDAPPPADTASFTQTVVPSALANGLDAAAQSSSIAVTVAAQSGAINSAAFTESPSATSSGFVKSSAPAPAPSPEVASDNVMTMGMVSGASASGAGGGLFGVAAVVGTVMMGIM